jgi:hypothetical protein
MRVRIENGYIMHKMVICNRGHFFLAIFANSAVISKSLITTMTSVLLSLKENDDNADEREISRFALG